MLDHWLKVNLKDICIEGFYSVKPGCTPILKTHVFISVFLFALLKSKPTSVEVFFPCALENLLSGYHGNACCDTLQYCVVAEKEIAHCCDLHCGGQQHLCLPKTCWEYTGQ